MTIIKINLKYDLETAPAAYAYRRIRSKIIHALGTVPRIKLSRDSSVTRQILMSVRTISDQSSPCMTTYYGVDRVTMEGIMTSGAYAEHEFTEEQKKQLDEYTAKWLKIGLSTAPLDFEAAKQAAVKCYQIAGLKEPTIFYKARSPMDAIDIIEKLSKEPPAFPLSKSQILNHMLYGNQEAPWLAAFDFYRNVFDCVKETKPLEGLNEMAMASGWWSGYQLENGDGLCVFQDRPEIISLDDRDLLHCDTGPAIKFSDGFAVHCIHGVRVTRQIVEAPQTLTPVQIENERNIEIRRIMLSRFGFERFVLESGIKPVQSDKFGVLYVREIKDDEPITLVKVTNSTPESGMAEPDGGPVFKQYFLKVPPYIRTAHEAVAWSFGETPESYHPGIQT